MAVSQKELCGGVCCAYHEVYAIEVHEESVETWKSDTIDMETVPNLAGSFKPKKKHAVMANLKRFTAG